MMLVNFPIELKSSLLKKAMKLNIFPRDIEESFVKGGGRGGQKLNKTSNCVQLKHLPTGIIVRCQKYREQNKNRMTAYRILIEKVEEKTHWRESERAKKIYKLKKQKQKRSKRAKEKILEAKKKQSELKEQRRRIDFN